MATTVDLGRREFCALCLRYMAIVPVTFIGTGESKAQAPTGAAPMSVNHAVKRLYIPDDVWKIPAGNDFINDNSEFSNQRKIETANFAMFWAKEYGSDPSVNTVQSKQFLPSHIMLECERFYSFYTDKLKFVTRGHSVSDLYKILFIVFGGDDGTAYGGASGQVGAFWTGATRIHQFPYGVVAHELGHTFQSFAHSDGSKAFLGGSHAIYEMTSQYMLFQVYPEWMTFENYHVVDYLKHTYLAFLHDANMYNDAYVLEYWSNRHGLDFVGKMWREGLPGEDPVLVYKRLNGLSQTQFNDEMHDAHRRFITWDLKRIEKVASRYANMHKSTLNAAGDGWYSIAADNCPENYGYNGIQLNVPAGGTQVSLEFKGDAGAAGYRAVHVEHAGWRYGFLAVHKDGRRTYGATYSDPNGTAKFTVPSDTAFLWLVVTGAPTEHWPRLSRQDESMDEQWPYQIRVSGTTIEDTMIQ